MPAPLIAAAAIQGGAQLVNTAMQGRQSKKNIQRTLAANKELAAYQNTMDLKFWDMQNQYNSPEQQMKRYEAAGLNPNLIYGTGSASAGNATSVPKYPDVRADFTSQLPTFKLGDFITMYQDVALRNAQIDNVKANTNSIEQKTATEVFNTLMASTKSENLPKQLYESLLLMRRKSVNELERGNLLHQQSYNVGIKTDMMKQLFPKQLESSDLRNKALQEDIVFKSFENEWRKIGINSSDHPFVRLFMSIMKDSGLLQIINK